MYQLFVSSVHERADGLFEVTFQQGNSLTISELSMKALIGWALRRRHWATLEQIRKSQ